MKKLLAIISILFFSSALLAEFRMERVNCTTKKTSNCGAYIYNSTTGEVYFCDSEKCKEVMPALEEGAEEVTEGSKKTKKSKIPKMKKKKKSKIPKFKKKKSE